MDLGIQIRIPHWNRYRCATHIKRVTNMTTNFTNFDLLKSPDLPNPGLKDWNRYLTNYNTWSNKFDKLKNKTNPTIEELETFFGQTPYKFDTVFHALKLKYKALIYNPSTIEKTMTPVQLYLSENPLWTVGLSATDVDHVLNNTVGTHKMDADEFEKRYNRAKSGYYHKILHMDFASYYPQLKITNN